MPRAQKAPAKQARPARQARAGAKPPVPSVERQPRAARAEAPADGLIDTIEQRRALSGFQRDNPDRLSGDALRQLANERGIAMSELMQMDDPKVREQLRYITAATYGG